LRRAPVHHSEVVDRLLERLKNRSRRLDFRQVPQDVQVLEIDRSIKQLLLNEGLRADPRRFDS
jgi:hypothetical protein